MNLEALNDIFCAIEEKIRPISACYITITRHSGTRIMISIEKALPNNTSYECIDIGQDELADTDQIDSLVECFKENVAYEKMEIGNEKQN